MLQLHLKLKKETKSFFFITFWLSIFITTNIFIFTWLNIYFRATKKRNFFEKKIFCWKFKLNSNNKLWFIKVFALISSQIKIKNRRLCIPFFSSLSFSFLVVIIFVIFETIRKFISNFTMYRTHVFRPCITVNVTFKKYIYLKYKI